MNRISICTAIGFADDVAILIRGKTQEELDELAQRVLNEYTNWGMYSKLAFSPLKSVVIPLHGFRFIVASLEGRRLENVTEVKYLVILLDKNCLKCGFQRLTKGKKY